MKLWKIFSTEFNYQTKRITTWLFLILLLVFPIVMILVPTPGDGIYPNNTFLIFAVTIMGGLIWLVMSGTIAGEAAARDVQTRIHPLMYTSSVSKLNYLGGRFLAAFAVNTLLLLSLPIGILLSFYIPGLVQDALLPFNPEPYLRAYGIIALPLVFVATTIQFTFAALSGKVTTSYLGSFLLAIFPQIIVVSTANLLGNWDLIKLLDPVGISSILGNVMQTWTPIEKNTRLITLEGMILWNRILWFSIAIGLLWITYSRFSFTNSITKSWISRFKNKPKEQTEMSAQIGIVRATAISVSQVQQNFTLATYLRQMFAIAWLSFKKIAKNPIGLTLVGLMSLISAGFGFFIMTESGIPIIPTTPQVLSYFTTPLSNVGSLWVIIPLLIMFFVGELLWQERDKGLSEIADAAPAPDWVLLVGKFLGISFTIVIWMGFLMIGGILMQLILSSDEIEMGLYLRTIFGLQLTDYLLFVLLVFVVHIIVNQKYLAFLLVLLIYIFMAFHSNFGVEHNMLIYGADPGWWYTDMRGFGPTLGPWLWFKAYWMAWAILLSVVAKLLWARGREQGVKHRLQLAKRRFSGSTLRVTILGAVLLFTLGGFIFYNTNVLNDYTTDSDINENQAKYELTYGLYRNTPQPQLTATKLQIELYPALQQAEIRAAYTLVNNDTVAIDSIHLGSVSGIEFSEVNFDRKAVGVVIDNEISHHIYALEQPLIPGDTLQLNFTIEYKHKGFQHNGTKPLVVENGTYFTNYDLLPSIGYLRSREINDATLRKKHKLAARPAIPYLYDENARKKPFSRNQTNFEVIIGTTTNEVAVAPGALQRTWSESDRRYFHYKSDGPIGGEYRILSAHYAVKESQWNDVAIRIYYHPGHAQNIDRMLHSAKASLEYFSEQFGPYPFGYLTLVEGAGNTGGASADAGIIYYREKYALMDPDESPTGFDLPYYIMAHEIAHQWWGIARLEPAYVEGAGVLIEGLSVYSGMQVLEKTYGDGHLQKYVNYLHSSYAIPRSLASASLLQADEPFLYYKKGGLAMYALSKYIGKEKVNAALRSLLHKHESGEVTLPTTLDLYMELQQVTPDSLNYLSQDLFEENTYWRLKTKQLSAEETISGNWKVMLTVEAQKFTVDNSGLENEKPMNDWLEIGLYEENKGLDEPLYLQMHHIKSGEQTIEVMVPIKPGFGGIDPNYLMIDVRLEDNIMQLRV